MISPLQTSGVMRSGRRRGQPRLLPDPAFRLHNSSSKHRADVYSLQHGEQRPDSFGASERCFALYLFIRLQLNRQLSVNEFFNQGTCDRDRIELRILANIQDNLKKIREDAWRTVEEKGMHHRGGQLDMAHAFPTYRAIRHQHAAAVANRPILGSRLLAAAILSTGATIACYRSKDFLREKPPPRPAAAAQNCRLSSEYAHQRRWARSLHPKTNCGSPQGSPEKYSPS